MNKAPPASSRACRGHRGKYPRWQVGQVNEFKRHMEMTEGVGSNEYLRLVSQCPGDQSVPRYRGIWKLQRELEVDKYPGVIPCGIQAGVTPPAHATYSV